MKGVHKSGHTLREELVRRHKRVEEHCSNRGKGGIRVNGKDEKDKSGPQRLKSLSPPSKKKLRDAKPNAHRCLF